MTAPKRRRVEIEILIPPYEQPDDWIKQQTDADPAVGAAFAHALINENYEAARLGEAAMRSGSPVSSEWAPFGDEMFIRWIVSPEPPKQRLSALYFISKCDGGYMVGAVSLDTVYDRPWRRIHRLVSHIPEACPARFETIIEAMAAVDDRSELTASWARGCLGWRPLLDEGYELVHAETWVAVDNRPYCSNSGRRKRSDACEVWSRKVWLRDPRLLINKAGAVLWVAGRRDKWVVSAQIRNPNAPVRQVPRKRKLGNFATRDQAFAAADDYILNHT
jgi:hypothetical protein